MSHLSRRYTNYYYVEVEKTTGFLGKKKVRVLKKVEYLSMNEQELQAQEKMLGISIPRTRPNAVFPCKHEERDFLPKSGKKSNRTHARMKRKNKARIRARK